MAASPAANLVSDFGQRLRAWRRVRRKSQLELALEARVSARHISFIETGRSVPSREMVLGLASALGVPLRERNALLQAAGYAPLFRETPLEAPEMAEMLWALKLVLRQHGPHGGAVAVDRRWDTVMANRSYTRCLQLCLGVDRFPYAPLTLIPQPRPNVLRLLFDPQGLRPHVLNWEPVARAVLDRFRAEVRGSQEAAARELLADLLAYPGVPDDWRESAAERPAGFVTPVVLRLPEGAARLFSTIATLGTPHDITLQELRIESFHSADSESEALVRRVLAADDDTSGAPAAPGHAD